ncbi:MAG: CDP-glucose 4,6-dehydratase, partial [Hyphomonadaceae bacterium]|nr:CDP-glucose 4,6-dehydratase [Clostridia bacterium]
TGHTGFKGSWLTLWLHMMGAKVTGYSLEPPTSPSLFDMLALSNDITDIRGDVRDFASLNTAMKAATPEVVFHLAAQPLVRESYLAPIETYEINVMGTVHVLEAVRQCGGVKACINITTDKCYDNKEWCWGYRESDPMGGFDPYSNSKGCSELVASAYRSSYFHPDNYHVHGTALATARAGNVIGGGDWAEDRLIPDSMRAILKGETIQIRSPHAIRPWQHVLEPLSGYLILAQQLTQEGVKFAEGWNFGPVDEDAKKVEWIVDKLCDLWGNEAQYSVQTGEYPHEANYLKLDISKSKQLLGWQPVWSLTHALIRVVAWYQQLVDGKQDMRQLCIEQILTYTKDAARSQ